MRVIYNIASVESAAAGTTYAATRLAESMSDLDWKVDLLSLGTPSSDVCKGYNDFRFDTDFKRFKWAARLGVSSAMRRALNHSDGDVFHTHGLWMRPNAYPASIARRKKAAFVLSPHGMLGEGALQFSHYKKRLIWRLFQQRAAAAVSCFHATAHEEYEDIRAFGLKQPVAVIPNGIDLPAVPEMDAGLRAEAPYVVSLGRIHPKKALDRLVKAWAVVAPQFPGWRLKIVGPSEIGYADELHELVRTLGLSSVDIRGPIFGDDKTALLANAELFALSTLNENFGLTVAESLAVHTPVISTKGAPWAGLEQHRCGWWIEHGVDALAAALKQAMSLSSEQRLQMGRRGRAWMQRDFGWSRIAQQTSELYHWLRNGGDLPEFVHVH